MGNIVSQHQNFALALFQRAKEKLPKYHQVPKMWSTKADNIQLLIQVCLVICRVKSLLLTDRWTEIHSHHVSFIYITAA